MVSAAKLHSSRDRLLERQYSGLLGQGNRVRGSVGMPILSLLLLLSVRVTVLVANSLALLSAAPLIAQYVLRARRTSRDFYYARQCRLGRHRWKPCLLQPRLLKANLLRVTIGTTGDIIVRSIVSIICYVIFL